MTNGQFRDTGNNGHMLQNEKKTKIKPPHTTKKEKIRNMDPKNMTYFVIYINNTMIYFNSHMRIDEQITNIIT